MSEAEWLSCERPERMLHALRERGSDRKFLLLGLTFVGYPRSYSTPRLQEVADAIAAAAEGTLAVNDVPWAWSSEPGSDDPFDNGPEFEEHCLGVLISPAGPWRSVIRCSNLLDFDQSECDERFAYQTVRRTELLRDIFGNPFRPATRDPLWLTSTVIALARGIYDERAFDRMPILADALQDAGCDNNDVLNHCRGAGPHVRGCWVVDLLLGKF